ncbi:MULTISPECIES: helix-turn-helix domain-containing protein [Chryseobacterium]|uniref:AraC family transcriptional activator of pobA n=1 Tax=Chryseobacterium camelliae TaxID=1265445 RepID=A0ABU0TK98_9FLAO|nr:MULTISPECIES: helix-turn-helix domain-containing protein [Chryseobacterium]MDT3409487.1 AraC family transcriptional activator of pobA [Pseudacidovorax intermedius]MDQ1096648.1 AraC family transcriptional activator of pobA [Chryseobacterium camelliae]MDQ1100590.1 AraC family transcriptional activator of pobA [Chryseobacterium sp. SORGH_AS_1048]MDR6087930.1 AraC family transcriptional activator of pobA [Chryseobacterium sp. SORGH_AS_0909]MDR6132304.1 AraC family transcriptional activator of p
MENTNITFKEFTKTYIRNFPDGFRYLQTPVQIYDIDDLFVKSMITPTPLLKADFNFIVFSTNGNFEQQVGNEIKKVSANQALLVLQGEVTSLLRQSPDVKGYYITFNDKILQQAKEYPYFTKLFTAAPIIQLSNSDSTFIEHIGQLLIQELNTSIPDEQIIIYLFQALLIKLLKSSESKKGLSRQFDIAISFRELLYKNYLEHYNVSDYARLLNISSNYLNRCIQNVWNKSAKQFMQEFIITQSQKYLQDFSLSVSDIAYRLNFNDPSYFGRLFKKTIGISPQKYRSRLMHDVSG